MTTSTRRAAEPFLWLLFSAGGVAAALAVPALLFLFGVAVPLGWIGAPDHAHLLAVLTHPVTRLALLALCALALVHAAHRLRHTVMDGLKLRRFATPITLLSYGAAAAAAAVAAYVLFAAV
jgi:fumarate reductase subunit D